MGQYHQTYALPQHPLERAKKFNHYSLAGGAKLCEQYYTWTHEYSGPLLASPCSMAVSLMITMGDWATSSIVTIGDYEEGEMAYLYSNNEAQVVDVTEQVTRTVGEALGFIFIQDFDADPQSPWLDLELPDDWRSRIDGFANMRIPDEDAVLVSSHREYLRPDAFQSPAHPVASCVLGGLWPTALLMTAVSDGLGGGDANFAPAGRWALASLGWMNRIDAQALGYIDVTDWALKQREVKSHLLNR